MMYDKKLKQPATVCSSRFTHPLAEPVEKSM